MWYLYIVECRDGSFYTGISPDVERRVTDHNSGKGARYTRGRGPVILRYQETLQSRSAALKREIQVKKMNRSEKMALIS